MTFDRSISNISKTSFFSLASCKTSLSSLYHCFKFLAFTISLLFLLVDDSSLFVKCNFLSFFCFIMISNRTPKVFANFNFIANMSSLSKLVDSINFQILIERLDDDEFDTFLLELWGGNKRETVLQLLGPNITNKKISQKKLIGIASKIITERDVDLRGHSTELPGNSIAETPSSVIGEIASFLDCTSYIAFSSTNRKMFVDCNSPNRLTKLDLSQFTVIDPSFCLMNHPKLRALKVNLHQMTALNISRDAITRHCPNLKKIWLNGAEAGAYSIDDFIRDNTGRCAAITTLLLAGFVAANTLNSQQLIRLLTEFPALTLLGLAAMQCRDNYDVDQFKSLCPQINEVAMISVSGLSYVALLTAFSSKLRCLKLVFCKPPFQIPVDSDWQKLEELHLHGTTKRTMDDLLNKAKNLKKIEFCPNAFKQGASQMSNIEIENAVENGWKQKSCACCKCSSEKQLQN